MEVRVVLARFGCDTQQDSDTVVRRFSYAWFDSDCVIYLQFLDLRRDIVKRMHSLSHTARMALDVNVSFSGFVTGVSVKRQWLEKVSVEEYTLEGLRTTLQSSRHTFRPYFEIVAREVVSQFLAPSAPHSTVHVT